MIFDAPNSNHLWASLLVEELVRCGVTAFFLAPGSRSTPLVTAVAAHADAVPLLHVDERGTAFAALGYARATRRPAAWVTTSGTAVANGMPAVVEAATDAVPLLLLTADRPPELRQTGANQTIDQPGLFGDYVRWRFDLPAPEPGLDPAMVLTTVDQAVYRAMRSPAGPVHLNLMFREPLAPDPSDGAPLERADHLRAWFERGTPYTTYAAVRAAARAEALRPLIDGARRGLIVAGRLDTPSEGAAVQRLARHLGWPLLADVGSQARLGPGAPTRIDTFDLLLGHAAWAQEHRPDGVLYLGRRATSKRLAAFLDATRPDVLAVIRPDPFRFDPSHRVTHRVETEVVPFVEALTAEPAPPSAPGWQDAWTAADRRLKAWLGTALSGTGLSEPAVARAVTRLIPPEQALVLASSMPVRDADTFATPEGAPVPVYTNRGASGIDGTVATAVGVARARGRPVTLLIGDLALLHDLNALMLLREVPVVVVVINNDGGGIFHFLPIARHERFFEPFFGTPHGLGFEHAARLFGLPYHRPDTLPAFEAVYQAACAAGRSALIEVVTDRHANVALHRRLLDEARAVVDGAIPR
ncbi:MAG: 2-succinyl-5-enolpyruvyl-6-hydroxy-3-cyclohexene-1-carboxylate synthase [Rhodothermaceae bacterium]|nr:MAG: 2-succinyl-5-enolpyruvyl-6-hydroxy-3-cyclohexene-1-carboxylate synthase [Rhodothermaceae bacterium]